METSVQLPPSDDLWDKRNLGSVEQLAQGVTIQWLENGRIVCFTVSTAARAPIDVWLKRSEQIVKSWPAPIPYLALQDVSGSTLTPYIRERSAQTVALTPKYLRGRSAVVMPRTYINQAIRLFVTVSLARQNADIQRLVFLERSKAIQWLLQYRA